MGNENRLAKKAALFLISFTLAFIGPMPKFETIGMDADKKSFPKPKKSRNNMENIFKLLKNEICPGRIPLLHVRVNPKKLRGKTVQKIIRRA